MPTTHTLQATPTHSRWNNALPPRLTIASGDTVHFECQDSSGAQVTPDTTVETFQQIDRNKIHALTGPVAINNAQPGDTLQIDILEVVHKGWGWSSIIPGLGFLKERFDQPFFFPWALDKDTTSSLAPAIVPLRPFCGIMGVCPEAPGEHRTRPPGVFGGNMDVRELTTGATLYLPVQVPNALFSCGDAHAAQGDGEVCINGIECPSEATLRFTLHKTSGTSTNLSSRPEAATPLNPLSQPAAAPLLNLSSRPEAVGRSGETRSFNSLRGPLIEAPAQPAIGPAWLTIASATDALTAAREATNRMIDLLIDHWHFQPEHAYLLCSVAMKLQLSQVVNEPMTTVAASLSKAILPTRQLFPTH